MHTRVYGDQKFPLLWTDSVHNVFIEVLPNGEKIIRMMRIPENNYEDRMRKPEWYNEHYIGTLEVPPEIEIDNILTIFIGQPDGLLVVIMVNGDIYILQY